MSKQVAIVGAGPGGVATAMLLAKAGASVTVYERGAHVPHSIPLVALGTGLLWFGWYGFNAGSQLKVDAVTGVAFLETDMVASFAGPAWMLLA